jgi:2'-5' RNA ligase
VAKTRTFIAVESSPELRTRVGDLVRKLERITADVKWVAAENLHWTLQFLGDVEDLELPEVCQRVIDATADITTFDMEASGAGAFPSTDRPRTLWIGAGKGHEAMEFLQGAIEKAIKPMGFRGEDRRFTPHLTIGRVVGRGRPDLNLAAALKENEAFDGGSMFVESVTVYGSTLGSGGPTYHVLGRAPLLG